MATIPTTDRKYYDTERKVNAMAEYAGALLPAAKAYQDFKNKQEEAKLKLKESQAKFDMNELTQAWRIQNMDDPSNPESLQQLQIEYDSILSQYREEIDPVFRNKWDSIGMNLKNNFGILNQNWGFKQSIDNEKKGFKVDAEMTRKNTVYEGLSPKETAQKIRDEITSKGGESYTSVPTQDVAITATNEAEKGYVDSFNNHIRNGNFRDIKAWLDEEREASPEDKNVSYKTFNKMEKELNTAWNKDLLRRYKNGEPLEVLQKEKPDFVPAKNVKQENQKTSKKPKELKYGDVSDEIKKAIDVLKPIYQQTKYGESTKEDRDNYELNVLKTLMDFKESIYKSTAMSDEDKHKALNIVYETAFDETLRDDVNSIVKNFKKIKELHLYVPGISNFLDMIGVERKRPEEITLQERQNIKLMGEKTARKVIEILGNIKAGDVDGNSQIMETVKNEILLFKKMALSEVYDFDFVNKNLEAGKSVISIPKLNDRAYLFMGYTDDDVLVRPAK